METVILHEQQVRDAVEVYLRCKHGFILPEHFTMLAELKYTDGQYEIESVEVQVE